MCSLPRMVEQPKPVPYSTPITAGRAAAEARREASRFRQGIQECVLEDLRVVLGKDSPDLAEIEEAAERLWSVPEAPCDPGPVMEMVERQAEAHARLQELLSGVRERLAAAGASTRQAQG